MTSDIVTFRMPDGSQISNDPRFHAQGLARQMQKQQAELLRRQQQSQVPPTDHLGGDAETEEDDEADTPLVNYSDWTGKQLKTEAQRRELDIAGLTKKSQFVELLEADDAEQEDEGEPESDPEAEVETEGEDDTEEE